MCTIWPSHLVLMLFKLWSSLLYVMIIDAVQYLRQLVASLSPQGLRFNLYGICDRVAWGGFLFKDFSFPLSHIPSIPTTCLSSGTGTIGWFEAAVPRDSLSLHSLKLKEDLCDKPWVLENTPVGSQIKASSCLHCPVILQVVCSTSQKKEHVQKY